VDDSRSLERPQPDNANGKSRRFLLSGNKLVMLRDNLQSSISKREKTIESMQERVKASPEDRTILNLLNRKLEQLEQKKLI
jgi:hypothetical protein